MSDEEGPATPPVNLQSTDKQSRPARKQVKPGQVTKNEVAQTGKEYSQYFLCASYCLVEDELKLINTFLLDIWYNKWAGGDREDNYSNKVKSQTLCDIRKDS
ncbi:Pre-mRNA-splicing factor, partial [Serendipita sp. 405]